MSAKRQPLGEGWTGGGGDPTYRSEKFSQEPLCVVCVWARLLPCVLEVIVESHIAVRHLVAQVIN